MPPVVAMLWRQGALSLPFIYGSAYAEGGLGASQWLVLSCRTGFLFGLAQKETKMRLSGYAPKNPKVKGRGWAWW